jgi:branched chain amino acid efflux pump
MGSEPARSEGRRAGVRSVTPLLPAVVAFGVSFGVLARAAGMGPVAATAMSATTFAGSAQFAAASVLEASGGALAAVAAAVLLNARYAPMSIAVAPGITGPWWRRLLQSQLIVDESWALSIRGPGVFDVAALVGAGLVLYPAWVGSTVAGAVAGDLIGDPARIGLDAAFPALFLGLLVPIVRSRRELAAALIGAAIALVLVPLAPPGVPIVASAAACLIGWRR